MKPLSLLSIFCLLLITFESIGQSKNYSDLPILERPFSFGATIGMGFKPINVRTADFNFRFEDETGHYLFEGQGTAPQNQNFIGFDIISCIYWDYRYFIYFGGQLFYSFDGEKGTIVHPSLGGGYMFHLGNEKKGNMPKSWLEVGLTYSYQLVNQEFFQHQFQRGDPAMQVNGETLLPEEGWVDSYSLKTSFNRHVIAPTFKINHLVSNRIAIYSRLRINVPFKGRFTGVVEANVKEGENIRERMPIDAFNLTSNGNNLTKPIFTPMFANIMFGAIIFF